MPERKPLVAHQQMKEFDPECERHWPILIVKAVDPGCTLELQIEIPHSKSVIRLTSTDDPGRDKKAFLDAVSKAFSEAWDAAERSD
jgi:hypothetical protein